MRCSRFHLAIFGVLIAALLLFVFLRPIDLTLQPVQGFVQLNWNDNSNNEAGFRIERSTNGVSFTQIDVIGADMTSYIDSSVLPSTTYYYKVRAYNANGNSAYSNTAQITTPAAAQCSSGQTQSCFSGSGTPGVGICQEGTQTCTAQGTWGSCTGFVSAQTEVCADAGLLDEDCDGQANCIDTASCSSHATCMPPVITSIAVNGVIGAPLMNTQTQTMTLNGANFHQDAVVRVGSVVLPTTIYTVNPSGTLITITTVPVPGFIDPALSVTVENPNGPNPSLTSAAGFVASENPVPVLTSLSQTTLVNPSTALGYTPLYLSGSDFVPTTMLEISIPGATPVVYSDPTLFVSSTQLYIPIPDYAPPNVYSLRVLNPPAKYSSQQLTLTVIQSVACPGAFGCPVISGVSVPSPGPGGAVTNMNGQIIVSGSGFGSDSNVVLNGLIQLPTVVNLQAQPTLTATIPLTVLPDTYTISVVNSGAGTYSNNDYTITVYEETPVITALDPTGATMNTAISMTVTGSGFYPDSIVRPSIVVSGVPTVPASGVTTYISETELTYQLDAGFSTVGDHAVRVINPGGTLSAPVTFTVSDGTGTGTTTGTSGSGSSGSGTSGSGSGSSGSVQPTAQCNDNLDNDGDGKIDYDGNGNSSRRDPGCSSLQDSSEINAPVTIPTNTTPMPGDGENVSDSDDGTDEDSTVRLVFWIVLVFLVGGIGVVIVLILRTLRRRARFKVLVSTANKTAMPLPVKRV